MYFSYTFYYVLFGGSSRKLDYDIKYEIVSFQKWDFFCWFLNIVLESHVSQSSAKSFIVQRKTKKKNFHMSTTTTTKMDSIVFFFFFFFNYFFGLVLSEYSNNPCNSCKTSFSFIFQHKRVRGKKLSETRLGLLAKWLESSLYWGKFFRKPSSFRYYKRKLRQMDLVS